MPPTARATRSTRSCPTSAPARPARRRPSRRPTCGRSSACPRRGAPGLPAAGGGHGPARALGRDAARGRAGADPAALAAHGHWVSITTADTGSDGSWSASVNSSRTVAVRAYWPGDGTHRAVASSRATVIVQPTLSLAASTKRLRAGGAIKLSGAIAPHKTAVGLLIQRRVRGGWRSAGPAGRAPAAASTPSACARAAGLYRARATFAGTSATRRPRRRACSSACCRRRGRAGRAPRSGQRVTPTCRPPVALRGAADQGLARLPQVAGLVAVVGVHRGAAWPLAEEVRPGDVRERGIGGEAGERTARPVGRAMMGTTGAITVRTRSQTKRCSGP